MNEIECWWLKKVICSCKRKLKNDFELHFFTYIRISSGPYHVTFPYKGILPFLGILT